MTDMINHAEAFELAAIKRDESNLARCYLDLRKQVADFNVWLVHRVEWLEYEMRNGGNFEYLNPRQQELLYIKQKMKENILRINT